MEKLSKITSVKNITPSYDDVVIGSGTLEEYKFQVLNFMSMLYDCIEKDNNYSPMGYSNLRPWVDNLCFEIKRVDKELPCSEYYSIDRNVYSRIHAIETNLEALTLADTDNHIKEVKKHCFSIWKELLIELTKLYNLKYKYEK